MSPAAEARLLRRIAGPGVRIVRIGPETWAAFPGGDRRRRPVVRLQEVEIRALTASGVLAAEGEARILSAEGRFRLARLRAGPDAHAAAHRDVQTRTMDTPEGERAVQVNLAESPLARLARPDPVTGQAFLTAAEVEAGERLRGQLARSTLNPRLTMDWSAPPAGRSGARGAGRDPAGASDSALAARDRVNAALDFVGQPLSSLLLDVLWREAPLGAIEQDRAWPRRSGRLALKLALCRLAQHYGLFTAESL